MKYSLILILLFMLMGCTGPLSATDSRLEFTSTIHYEKIEQNSWLIMQPPEGQWRIARGIPTVKGGPRPLEYLPKYFPSYAHPLDGWANVDNFFYALYKIDDDVDIAIWVRIVGELKLKKQVYYNFLVNN